jgi:hypothetical protein
VSDVKWSEAISRRDDEDRNCDRLLTVMPGLCLAAPSGIS